jgi:hypothetical protein
MVEAGTIRLRDGTARGADGENAVAPPALSALHRLQKKAIASFKQARENPRRSETIGGQGASEQAHFGTHIDNNAWLWLNARPQP